MYFFDFIPKLVLFYIVILNLKLPFNNEISKKNFNDLANLRLNRYIG